MRAPSDDRAADKGDIGHVAGPVGVAERLRDRGDVLRATDDGEDIAAMDDRVGQDRDADGGRAADDLAQEDAAGCRHLGELGQRLAVGVLAGDVDVDALGLQVEQFRILDLLGTLADEIDQRLARAGKRDDVALAQDRVRGRILDDAVAANAFDEDAGVGHQRLSFRRAHAGDLGALAQPEGAQLEAPPDRAGAADLLAAAEPGFVVLAGLGQIDPEQLRAEHRENDGRAHGAEDIGHRIGDRHRVEIFLGLLGERPRRLMASVARPIEAEIVWEPAYRPAA